MLQVAEACPTYFTSRRKKLEQDVDLAIDSKVDGAGPARIASDLDLDVQSFIQVDMPPWADSYEISST